MVRQHWREAEAIIGSGADDDYEIAPTTHAEAYREVAPRLADILESGAVRVAAEDYERSNAAAVDAQRAFKVAASRANLSVLAIAALGATVMLLALFEAPSFALLPLGVAGGAAGAYAAYLTQRLKQTQMFQRWMSARADAEERRREYFRLVANIDPAEAGSSEAVSLPLLQLEYFRRYHLDVQIRYYDERQKSHQREADRTATFAAFAVFLAALFTGVGGALGSGLDSEWAGLAAFGILGAALTSFATTREAIGQDARNAERYSRTHAALRRLSARVDDVREAVAAGNYAALAEYLTAVEDHLSVEHRQWLNEAESTRSGLERLEEALVRPSGSSSPPTSAKRP
jgi:hypothetical protein